MPDSPGSGPRRHNRANWVALRTLRQLPKIVGETGTGEPIFEVQSVRLLLPRDSGHFIRMTVCAKCGREVPGAPVLTAADLEHSPNPVICKSCVRSATAPVFSAGRRPALAGPEARNGARNGKGKIDAPPANGGGPLHPGVSGDVRAAIDGALSDTRDQLDTLGGVVEGLVRSRQEESGRAEMRVATPATDAASPSDLEVRLDRLQAALDQEVLRARDAVLEVAQDTDAVRQLQDDVRRRVEDLVDQRVEAVREELTALAAIVADGLPGSSGGAGRLDVLDGRIDAMAERSVAEAQSNRLAHERLTAHVVGVVEQHRSEWEATLGARLAETRTELARVSAATAELGRVQDRRGELFDHVVARLSQIDEVAAELRAEGEAQRVELRAALEASVADLQTQVAADVDRAVRRSDELGRAQEELDVRLAERLRQLEDRFGYEVGRAVAAASQHEHSNHDRIEEQINDRLDRGAERAQRRAESERVRVDALDRRLTELPGLVEAAAQSIRAELHDLVRESLAEIRSAITAADARSSGRLRALEAQVEESSAEVSRLAALQPALDEGLGQLRSEIAEVRDQGRRRPAVLGEGSGQGLAVPEPVRPVFVEADRGRGRGGKSAAKAQLAAVSTVTDELLRERRQLAARITWLEDSVQAAADAAAHAARQAAAIAPLRRTVKTLESELEAKDAILAELTETVEQLRRPRANPAAAATKKASSPKQPPARKSARRTPS